MGEHENAPEIWVRNRRTGIAESVGTATLDYLLERTFLVGEGTDDEREEPLYEEIDAPALAAGGGSWEVYEDEGGSWWAQPVGTGDALGPYKSKATATRGVERRFPNASIQDAGPPDAQEIAAQE